MFYYCSAVDNLWTDDTTVRDIFYYQVIKLNQPCIYRMDKQCSAEFLEKWEQLTHRIAKYVDADNFSGSVLSYCL